MGWVRRGVRLVLVGSVLSLAARVDAQDTLQHVKDLYASAAYEDALAVVTRLDAAEVDPAVDQYRVYCLVALGRTDEAERAVEEVLKARPRYRPDASDVSPHIQELFSKVRRRLGPSIVKGMYVDAKAALDRKDHDGAIARFEEMLRMADDPDVKDEPSISELRLLGAGFLELSRALAAKSAAPQTAAQPAGAPTAPAPQPRVVTPPIAIREALPPWVPVDPASKLTEFRGAVKVHIDAQGKVTDAQISEPVHPAYDRLLVEAARTWTYQPAQANGVAVPSEKVVQVVLKPR